MARQPHIIRPYHLHMTIPEDLYAEIALHLWSDVEGRIPYGTLGKLINSLLRDYLTKLKDIRNAQS